MESAGYFGASRQVLPLLGRGVGRMQSREHLFAVRVLVMAVEFVEARGVRPQERAIEHAALHRRHAAAEVLQHRGRAEADEWLLDDGAVEVGPPEIDLDWRGDQCVAELPEIGFGNLPVWFFLQGEADQEVSQWAPARQSVVDGHIV